MAAVRSVGSARVRDAGRLEGADRGGAGGDLAILGLAVRGYRSGGLQQVDLFWSGSSTGGFGVYRDGLRIATVLTTGYTDRLDRSGSGSYRYRVREIAIGTQIQRGRGDVHRSPLESGARSQIRPARGASGAGHGTSVMYGGSAPSHYTIAAGPLAVIAITGVLGACGVLLAACDSRDGGEQEVLTLRVVTAPGLIEFDTKRLTAQAGRITFVLINEKRKGHNIRIQTGGRCCFRPGSADIGGTQTIGTGRTRAVLDLTPGVYTYLCSAGGHWRTQHGTLVVR